MFLTNVLLKRVKSKNVLVRIESLISGHPRSVIRERLADKVEVIKFDPWVQMECLYRETKKITSIK